MTIDTRTLGTLLRHLVGLLDGAVEDAYRSVAPGYRPRYTPIVRVLLKEGPSSLRKIAEFAGVSHSAVSQTVSQMVRVGLATTREGVDARERVVGLTPLLSDMMPLIERQWRQTEAAARALEAEIGIPLAETLAVAIDALERRPFSQRLVDQAPLTLSDKD